MPEIPFIPENAPFTARQRLWLNGYLAGLFSDASGMTAAALPLPAAEPALPLVVLYGSQTGSAEGLAKKAAAEAKKRGFAPKVLPMDQYASVNLATEERVLVITSTYGDGEPPDNAQPFWSYLASEGAPSLGHLRFSVLALGDTNYPAFCQFGKNCDERLEHLGAQRVYPRIDCDVDYEGPAQKWTEGVFAALKSETVTPLEAPSIAQTGDTAGTPSGYSRRNPFPARLVTNRILTAPGSGKEVRHFEISLAGSGLTYEVGDALGVIPTNCPAAVDALLAVLGYDGEEAVQAPDGQETSLRMALQQHYDLAKASPELLAALAGQPGGEELQSLLEPSRREDLQKHLWGRELIDLLAASSARWEPSSFVSLLKKLQPRLYSISSSPKAHPEEVHLTVAAVRYDAHGRSRKGVASTFLADRAAEGCPVPVFVQTSHGFRLPADGDIPVIMCGPGTGIAPFRAFLEERAATGAKGRNWLFFGDQKRATDFLYQEQLETWLTLGHLSRLDLAFSRDQTQKIYVQHRMQEQAAELWAWFEAGAHFYVCGDASRMARDVDAALHAVVQTAGGLSADAAAEYIAGLKTQKRYQRDVY